MDLNANIRYQGCLLGVQKFDFTNDRGENVRGVSLHVSTSIPADQGVGHASKKLSYKGEYADYPKLAALIGRQVSFSLNNQGSGVLGFSEVPSK